MKILAKAELVLPPFLNEDEDDIHERMLELIPTEYDSTEGSLVWDLTRPTAMEIAKILGFDLPLIIQMMFPQFAEGVYLDYHGEREGVKRREAIAAKGNIVVEGADGTLIPAGSIVMTDEVDGVTIEYVTIVDATIDNSGTVTIPIEAVEPGSNGNVPANSINNFLEPIVGVSSLTNVEDITGGIDEEDDEEYRERILQTNRTRSFTGNKNDYIRWAKEVPGVGDVLVVPEWDGPGTVKVLISSSTGTVASPELIQQVQERIAPDGSAGGGLAPIGALVTVDSINGRTINLTFDVILEEGFELNTVIQAIKMQLSVYLSEEIEQGGLVRYTKIGAIIMTTPGVIDYDNLLVNNDTENIQLNPDEVAVVGEVTANEL